MSTFAIGMLSLFCSTMCIYKITGATNMSSLTSIGTRLVVQSLTDHNGKNCHQTCNEIGLTCDFSKIHLLSSAEIKNKILELLANKQCFQLSTTLVDNQYKYHNQAYDPAYNVKNYCTQGFERIGYTKAYPVCETEGTYRFARICQCGSNDVFDYMTSIGTRLISQDFKTSGQKDCSKTCEEAGMVCDFDNFGSMSLREWKTIIGNILPREICHSYYPDSPSVLVSNGWKNYNNPMDPRFNKWNNCAQGYMSNGGTNVPQCSGNGSSQFARICQCKTVSCPTLIDKNGYNRWMDVGTYGCWLQSTEMYNNSQARKQCKDLNSKAVLPTPSSLDSLMYFNEMSGLVALDETIWMNGFAGAEEGQWYRVDKDGTRCAVPYFKWMETYPNEGKCMALMQHYGPSWMLMKDDDCAHLKKLVCHIPSINPC